MEDHLDPELVLVFPARRASPGSVALPRQLGAAQVMGGGRLGHRPQVCEAASSLPLSH